MVGFSVLCFVGVCVAMLCVCLVLLGFGVLWCGGCGVVVVGGFSGVGGGVRTSDDYSSNSFIKHTSYTVCNDGNVVL